MRLRSTTSAIAITANWYQWIVGRARAFGQVADRLARSRARRRRSASPPRRARRGSRRGGGRRGDRGRRAGRRVAPRRTSGSPRSRSPLDSMPGRDQAEAAGREPDAELQRHEQAAARDRDERRAPLGEHSCRPAGRGPSLETRSRAQRTAGRDRAHTPAEAAYREPMAHAHAGHSHRDSSADADRGRLRARARADRRASWPSRSRPASSRTRSRCSPTPGTCSPTPPRSASRCSRLRLAARPAKGAMTFGFKRVEILSAQANGVTLLILAAFVAYEAIRRLFHPPDGSRRADARGGAGRDRRQPRGRVDARGGQPREPQRRGQLPAHPHRPVRRSSAPRSPPG